MLRGKRFGRLTVQSARAAQGRVRCVCDCGRRFRPRLERLRDGDLPSCGCVSAPPLAPVMVECECGNLKVEAAEACDRCAWLDGRSVEGDVVAALRVLGEVATKEAIMLELGAGPPGSKKWQATERRFYRLLAVLRQSGRVASVMPHLGEAYEQGEFRYVPAARDPAATRNKLRDHAARGGYYVYAPRQRHSSAGGEMALHVLVNTRRAG